MQLWTDNHIGDEGVEILCEVLKCNTTLTCLNLSRDEKKTIIKQSGKKRKKEIKKSEITKVMITSTFLASTMKLWSGNDIEYEGAEIIGEVLKSNSTLTELNLACDERKSMNSKN